MTCLDTLLSKIEDLRDTMHLLIEEDQQLCNPQILSVSQKLDRLLNQLQNIKK